MSARETQVKCILPKHLGFCDSFLFFFLPFHYLLELTWLNKTIETLLVYLSLPQCEGTVNCLMFFNHLPLCQSGRSLAEILMKMAVDSSIPHSTEAAFLSLEKYLDPHVAAAALLHSGR